MAKTITASYSELDTMRQCGHKHELAYVERWREPEVGPALMKGTLWHSVMETHYRAIWNWQVEGRPASVSTLRPDLFDRQLHNVVMDLLYEQGQPRSDWSELIEWMYLGHLEHYGLDSQWKIVAVEHAPVMWLPTDRGGRSRFRLKMKIDLIVAWDGKLWIVDHKSGKDLPKDKELDIDDQFGLYTWGMRKLGKRVMGSCHSAARTQKNKDQTKNHQPLDERFKRSRLYRTDKELDTIAVEAYRTLLHGYRFKPGEAPRSPNPDTCRWRCSFTEACLAGRKGLDERAMLIDLGFVQNFERH